LNYLNPPLLSLALTFLLLGCGSESDKPPLVPDIASISVQDYENISYLRSVGDELNLYANILYTDGTSSSTADELNWESNDTNIISVNNGHLTVNANHGSVSISINYREKLSSKSDESKIVEIVPIEDINISSSDAPTLDIDYSVTPPHTDINTTGTYPLKAMGQFKDDNNSYDITNNVVWTSGNVTVATMGISTGEVTILASGHTDINISLYSEVNSSLSIDVNLSN